MDAQVKALKDQVVALVIDCHYLVSLLNTTDNIDWDNWPEGRKIKEDLEHAQALLMDKDPETEVPIRRNVKPKVAPPSSRPIVLNDATVTPSFPRELLTILGLH